MPGAIPLRNDFDAVTLRDLARRSKDNRQSRRLLALAAVYDGMSRAAAARVGGMDRQSLRDWVHRFNGHGPDGLFNTAPPGRAAWLSDAQMAEFDSIVAAGPDPERDGVVRWRRCDLAALIEQRFGVVYAARSISALLARLGYVRISARPRHPGQDAEAIEAFKKNFPDRLSALVDERDAATDVEVWFQDEARIGQKKAAPVSGPSGEPALGCRPTNAMPAPI